MTVIEMIERIGDTDGQKQAMDATIAFMREAHACGYNWISEQSIEAHIGDSKLSRHRGYILRVMQERGIVIGWHVRGSGHGAHFNVWQLKTHHCQAYHAREIPESHILV